MLIYQRDVTGGINRLPIQVKSVLPTHPSAASLALQTESKREMDLALQRVARLINIAKKPVIYAGQGVLAGPEGPLLLKELADRAEIPVTTTLQGLGAYDELEEKSLHMLGMHGSPYANMAIQEGRSYSSSWGKIR